MARKRGSETIGDMVRSMAVVLIPVALIAGFVGLVRPSAPEVRDVEWVPALESARAAAEYDLVGPASVPEGWTASQVTYETGASLSDPVWRLSFVTEGDEYVGLVQRTGDVEAVVRRELPGFEPDGRSLVEGQSWQRYRQVDVDEPDHALVSDRPDSVVIVLTSDDGYSLVEEFAGSLR